MKPARETGTGTGSIVLQTALKGTQCFHMDRAKPLTKYPIFFFFPLSRHPEERDGCRKKMEETGKIIKKGKD